MKRALLMAVVGMVWTSFGCGSTGSVVDAADAAVGDAPIDDAPEADAAPDAAAEVAPTVFGLPLPQGVAPPILLAADATLTGAGRTACSHQDRASGGGDRWCAFRRPGAVPGTVELWVTDVSAAARGAVPSCDGSSTSCLRLTTTLWQSYGNDFEGDTLIFYADAPPTLKTSSPYLGPVYAWRPGWTRARRLAANGSLCVGHRVAPVAACLDDPTGDPDNPDDVQLRVGVVADLSDATLPALPGRWPFRNDGTVAWQIAFSPDGETFAISVPDAAHVGQTLSVIPTRAVATATLRDHVLDGIQPWVISNDGKKIFFYRGPKSDGVLSIADFPAGTNEKVLATKVYDYAQLGRGAADSALLLRLKKPQGGHSFQLLRERDKPETAVTVFENEGVLEGISIAPDLSHVAWIDPDFRGVAIRVSDLSSCAFNPDPAPSASDVGFVDDASFMYWAERRPGGLGARDGMLAAPGACAERVVFARTLGFVTPVGHRGLIYGDERDDDGRLVTLKYAGLAPGRDEAARGGVRVHERVSVPVTLVDGVAAPEDTRVVYRAEATEGRPAGVYMFAPSF
jgi:hypothetical protein